MKSKEEVLRIVAVSLHYAKYSDRKVVSMLSKIQSGIEANGSKLGVGCDIRDFLALDLGISRLNYNRQPESVLVGSRT
jgi:hypothetical protein